MTNTNQTRYALAKEQTMLQETMTPESIIQSLEHKNQDIRKFITGMNSLRPALGPESELWVQSIEFDPEFCAGEASMTINEPLETFFVWFNEEFGDVPQIVSHIVVGGQRVKFYEGLDYLCHNCYAKNRVEENVVIEYIRKEAKHETR